MKNTMKWIQINLRSHKLKIVMVIILNILNSLSYVINAVLMKGLLDHAVSHNREKFVWYAFGLASVLLSQIVIHYLQRYFDVKAKSDIENSLKMKAYQKLLHADYSQVARNHSGEYLNRMTNDVVVVSEGVSIVLPDLIGMLSKLIFASIVLIMLEPWFSALFLIGGLMIIILSYLFRKKMKELHKNVQEADGQVRSFLQETLQNIIVLRAFSVQDKAKRAAKIKMDKHKKTRMERVFFGNICNIGFGGAMNGGYLIGLIWCGFEIMEGKISYGTLASVLQLISQILQPIAQVTAYLPKFYGMIASAERLMEIDAMDLECADDEIEMAQIQQIYKKLNKIELKHICFSYPGTQKNILEDAKLVIEKGEHIAIMGRSGAGKSTMFKLLLSIYKDYAGEINVISGDTVYPVNASIRGLFTYVPQGNLLLSGTILDAIDLFHEEGKTYTSSERATIKKVCDIACATSFIENLPKGYETPIGEKGAGLSEGQIQRLAIARALYSDAPVLLLDEATSALDMETELQVLQNLKQLTDKTVIIVTHKRAALDVCNKVVELRERKFIVREQGDIWRK